MMVKSVGFKAKGQRLMFLIMGLTLILLINFFVFGWIFVSWPSWVWAMLLLVLIGLGWEWYRWLRVWKNTFYVYDQKGLTITNFRKKDIFVPKDKIEKIQKIKLPYLWTPSLWFRQTDKGLYVLTSTDNVIEISLKWGEQIYISPRKDLFAN